MLLTVFRLVIDGQTPARIVAEMLLIGCAVYLLTFVVWPRRFARRTERTEIETIRQRDSE
ncbi:MAG: hypothetical protein V3V01_05520, partial [Acidimicrobiales bacterium]